MHLLSEPLQSLHHQAQEAAKVYKRAEADLLDVLQKVEEKRLFAHLRYPTLFDYTVKELGLSEAVAYNFINVARKAREIPEIKQEIRSGNLTVSKVRKIVPVLQKENAAAWLEKAKILSQKQLEQEVAKVLPAPMLLEKARYMNDQRIELRLSVHEQTMRKLRRAQDLVSQKQRRPADLEGTFEVMAGDFLYRHDPLKKAERSLQRKDEADLDKQSIDKQNPPVSPMSSTALPATVKNPSAVQNRGTVAVARQLLCHRSAIPAQVRHKVVRRDQGRCAYRDAQDRRCESRRWLELHHVIPVSRGGGDTVENLRLLCSAHHKTVHQPASDAPDKSEDQKLCLEMTPKNS